MDSIRQYVLSIIMSAVVCSICLSLIDKKSTAGTIVKISAGMFLLATIITPLVNVRVSGLGDYFEDLGSEGSYISTNAVLESYSEMSAIIKERTEAYILDKAASLKLDITVSVILSQDTPPVPYSVEIYGNASPYAKKRLQEIITTELGISEVEQIWT